MVYEMPWLSKNELSLPTFSVTLNHDLKEKGGLIKNLQTAFEVSSPVFQALFLYTFLQGPVGLSFLASVFSSFRNLSFLGCVHYKRPPVISVFSFFLDFQSDFFSNQFFGLSFFRSVQKKACSVISDSQKLFSDSTALPRVLNYRINVF